MLAFARIGMFVERRAVEERQAVRVLGKCAGTQSRITPMPCLMAWSIKNMKSSGVPKREVGA